MRLERVLLPGVGTRLRFATRAGLWIGVIRHLNGNRDLVVYRADDPDTVQTAIRLTEQESHELAEVLYPHSAEE